MNAVNSPTEAVLSVITLTPPYPTITPKVEEDKISAIGKKIELYHTVF